MALPGVDCSSIAAVVAGPWKDGRRGSSIVVAMNEYGKICLCDMNYDGLI